jgi:hypothetical protein
MTCSVDGCEKPIKGKSGHLCSGHAHRLARYGSPTGVPEPKKLGVCAVEGCGGGLAGGGYCRKHYHRYRRHGDPLAGGIEHGDAQRFMAALSDTGTDDCIPWPFGKTKDGYGRINWQGTPQGAHVVSLTLSKGEKPSPAHESCHSCGNGHLGCVNPKHLYWGTRKENVADMIAHDTAKFFGGVKSGETASAAKFSDATIEEVRSRLNAGERQVDIAKDVGMSQAHVSRIKLYQARAANDNNEAWRVAA